MAAADMVRVVMVGHVDHGKSTLLGRLFYETDSLPEGRYEAIQEMCRRRGMPFEWAFLTDSLQAERDQGVTIDTTQIAFKTKKRPYMLIDAPGHLEFLRNMITGAATSDAAFLLIDAKEGIQQQTRRHARLLAMLAVEQFFVVMNKMDLVNFDQKIYRQLKSEMEVILQELGMTARGFIPLSAREGDGVAEASKRMSWYQGKNLLAALDDFTPPRSKDKLPLRLMVQDIYKFDERRIIAGRVEQGTVRVGDEVLFLPSGLQGRVHRLEQWSSRKTEPLQQVRAGGCFGMTLRQQIFVERGHIGCHKKESPAMTHELTARLFWLGKEPLRQGACYDAVFGTARHQVEVLDIYDYDEAGHKASSAVPQLPTHAIADVGLRSTGYVVYDQGARFIVRNGYEIAGGGLVLDGVSLPQEHGEKKHIFVAHTRVKDDDRHKRNGHKGGVFWLTGLSGSGKSTIATELERQLFVKGYQVFMLDGDNLRHGLNEDLDFSAASRRENIRRAGAVAALMEQAGMVVLAAFISPYRDDRITARRAAQSFHEIYIKASLDTCEARDPKGLYQKARAGDITDFTGISAPYEAPQNPECIVDSDQWTVEQSVGELMAYIEKNLDSVRRS